MFSPLWASVLFLTTQYFSLYDNNYESFGVSHCSHVGSSVHGVYDLLLSFAIVFKTWARVVVKIPFRKRVGDGKSDPMYPHGPSILLDCS